VHVHHRRDGGGLLPTCKPPCLSTTKSIKSLMTVLLWFHAVTIANEWRLRPYTSADSSGLCKGPGRCPASRSGRSGTGVRLRRQGSARDRESNRRTIEFARKRVPHARPRSRLVACTSELSMRAAETARVRGQAVVHSHPNPTGVAKTTDRRGLGTIYATARIPHRAGDVEASTRPADHRASLCS
jgi:hypothetical protein